jgi:hypothetical protein
MYELFARTLSQGLQAFMPVAVYFAYAHGQRRSDLAWAARWAMAAAALLTVPAGHAFQHTSHQAGWEAALATTAAAITIAFGRAVRSDSRLRSRVERASSGEARRSAFGAKAARVAPWSAIAAGAALTLLLVRQTMEIAVVLEASLIQLRSLEATQAASGAVAAAAFAAFVWTRLAARLSRDTLRVATLTFTAVFLVQALVYAFHESAEARVLPWSEILHTASEPYGPEGEYGRGVSYLLFVLPMVSVLVLPLGDVAARVWRSSRRHAVATASMLGVACVVLIAAEGGPRLARSAAAPAAPAIAAASLTGSPHVLFRHTGVDAAYNLMTVASIDRPSTTAGSALRCERVSFSAGRGICLQADRGMFTTYKAVFFDRTLAATGSMKLQGSPSRSRVSPDGRVGAFTVFLSGHAYAAVGFSTQTMLVDMASGDPLGELEQFATWRDGARFKAADFNFWGVTFTRDSNVFYASLGTGGKTYLVKGDLGLRKLTVLLDNVECPSLSPDNRLIVFKRRVATAADAWRLYVLDLATMAARPLAAETRYVDDQVEWLDNGHVLYAIQRPSSATSDVWLAGVPGVDDDSAAPRVYLPEASSPIVVR